MNTRKTMSVVLLLCCVLVFAASSIAQTWSQLSTVGAPPTDPGGAAYDATNNRLIVFFPLASGGQVWVLTNANGLGGASSWSQVPATGSAPINDVYPSVNYDSSTNQLIVYGGCSAHCGSPLSDVSVLSNANGLGGAPIWTQSTTTPPEARENQSAIYNSLSKRMVAFGGGLAFFGTDQNDTRVLTPANAASSDWSTLTTGGTLPGIREGNSAVYDQTHNVMTIFAGDEAVSTCCPYNILEYSDVWTLSNADGTGAASPTWTMLTPTGVAPPPRDSQSAVYDSSKNVMYVFGGAYFSNATQTSTVLGDLWKLTNANGRSTAAPKWTQIGQLGTPPGANANQAMVLDRAHQRIILFGGRDRNFQSHTLTFILDLLQH